MPIKVRDVLDPIIAVIGLVIGIFVSAILYTQMSTQIAQAPFGNTAVTLAFIALVIIGGAIGIKVLMDWLAGGGGKET